MIRSRLGLRAGSNAGREDLSIEDIKKRAIPKHVAIIMDGNGRWARKRGQPRLAGHRAGSRAVRQAIETSTELGVTYLTLYTFSSENWRRPKDEVSGLMSLFEEQLSREIDELDEKGVRVRVLGRIEDLPESTRNSFLKSVERTRENNTLNLNLALNYGGRQELLDAAKAVCKAVDEGRETTDFDEETFSNYLYTSGMPDPELLIRTSGELRISNFLLWQIAYAEIWVTDKLWPDFSRKDYLRAVADFQHRKRRFGGLDQE